MESHSCESLLSETARFFTALGMASTDFFFMATIFPGREDWELKRKYLFEQKKNPDVVVAALANKTPLDKDLLQKKGIITLFHY